MPRDAEFKIVVDAEVVHDEDGMVLVAIKVGDTTTLSVLDTNGSDRRSRGNAEVD